MVKVTKRKGELFVTVGLLTGTVGILAYWIKALAVMYASLCGFNPIVGSKAPKGDELPRNGWTKVYAKCSFLLLLLSLSLVVQRFGVGLVIERSLVRLPAGALSSQLGQLSLPSLRDR